MPPQTVTAAAPKHDSARSTHHGALLAVGLVAVLALVCLIVGITLWQTRRSVQERAEEAIVNLTLSLERSLTRDLIAYDTLLQSVANSIRVGANRAELERQLALWRDIRNDAVGAVLTMDPDGVILRLDIGRNSKPTVAVISSLAAHRAQSNLGLHAG